MKPKTFTEAQFVEKMMVAGFVHTWKSWDLFCQGREIPANLNAEYRAQLRAIGLLTLGYGPPKTPEHAEALLDLGIKLEGHELDT